MNKYTFTGQGHKFKVKYKVKVLASESQTMPLLDWIDKHRGPHLFPWSQGGGLGV